MMRWLVVLLGAGAAAAGYWWWRRGTPAIPGDRRGPGRQGEGAQEPVAPTPEVDLSEPPKLGGDVPEDLLAILACPLDKQPVTRVGNYLVCQSCQRHYPIRDGIPVMLVDEALTPDQAAAAP